MANWIKELEAVYREQRRVFVAVALNITGCRDLAEDAVHEAFARLCGLAQRPQGKVVAFVVACVRNAAVDARRQRSQRDRLAESFFEASVSKGASSDDRVDNSAENRLRELIDRLDEASRELLLLKTFGNLTFAELSVALQLPAATLATRYRRLLLRLQADLSDREKNHE